jgi:hypothetical protein
MRSRNFLVQKIGFVVRVDIRADVVSELIVILERSHNSERLDREISMRKDDWEEDALENATLEISSHE